MVKLEKFHAQQGKRCPLDLCVHRLAYVAGRRTAPRRRLRARSEAPSPFVEELSCKTMSAEAPSPFVEELSCKVRVQSRSKGPRPAFDLLAKFCRNTTAPLAFHDSVHPHTHKHHRIFPSNCGTGHRPQATDLLGQVAICDAKMKKIPARVHALAAAFPGGFFFLAVRQDDKHNRWRRVCVDRTSLCAACF